MFPVAILAGGMATRMYPATMKVPKALLDVAGKPFIDHQLVLLRRRGVEQVVLCLGHLGQMVEDHVGDGGRYGLAVTYSYDGDRLLGTGGALRKATDSLSGPFFVLYGDSYLDIDYAAVRQAYQAAGKTGLMTVYHNEDQFDTSNVIFEDGLLLRYSKKVKTPEMCYIDYGLGVLTNQAFSDFMNQGAFDLAEVYELLCENDQLAGYEVQTRFYEIGSASGLDELDAHLCGRDNA